jgi:hypothetical protein
MGRVKKKPQKNKKHNSKPLSTQEQSLIDSILSNISEIKPESIGNHIKSPSIAIGFIEKLPLNLPETKALVMAIRDIFDQKDVQKAIKKVIFRLKQQGVSIPENEDKSDIPFINKGYSDFDPEVYIGPIDGTGTRGLLVVVHQASMGIDTGIGVVNSNEGFIQFLHERFSKKRLKEVKELFTNQVGVSIRTSLSHACAILEKAYSRTEIKTGDAVNNYLKIRPLILDNCSPIDHTAIYEFIDPDKTSDKILTNSLINKLLDHELLKSWLIQPESIKPVLDEISQVEDSLIIISDDQKAERINEIKENAISDIFSDPVRLILKDDLEEMAFFFYKLDQIEYAHLCLSAADTVTEKNTLMRTNLFLDGYLERSLDYYLSMIQKITDQGEPEEESSPLILTP